MFNQVIVINCYYNGVIVTINKATTNSRQNIKTITTHDCENEKRDRKTFFKILLFFFFNFLRG